MNSEIDSRYLRQLIIPGWGTAAQERLARSTVFAAGAGGLGSPVLLYLAAAGVGRLIICDSGTVEISNLNRQVIYTTGGIGTVKADSAAAALARINPEVEVIAKTAHIDDAGIDALAEGSDILVDCLDNFSARYVLNRYAVNKGVPLVHAGVEGLSGQATFIHPPETPCLNCIFPEGPEEPVREGPIPVAGAAVGLIGCLEALEVLKFITGIGSTLEGRILHFDGEMSKTFEFSVEKNPGCPVCGRK